MTSEQPQPAHTNSSLNMNSSSSSSSSNIWSPQRTVKREATSFADKDVDASMLLALSRGASGGLLHSASPSSYPLHRSSLVDSEAAYRSALYASAALTSQAAYSAQAPPLSAQATPLSALGPPLDYAVAECRECSMTFSSYSPLALHNETAHALFTCRHCFATLTSRSNLDRHTRLHSGHRPYVCTICQKVCQRFESIQKCKLYILY